MMNITPVVQWPTIVTSNQMLTANYKSLTSNSNRSHQIQITHSKFKSLTANSNRSQRITNYSQQFTNRSQHETRSNSESCMKEMLYLQVNPVFNLVSLASLFYDLALHLRVLSTI